MLIHFHFQWLIQLQPFWTSWREAQWFCGGAEATTAATAASATAAATATTTTNTTVAATAAAEQSGLWLF